MSLLQRLRKHWRAGIATIIAGSMLAGGLTAVFAVPPTGGIGHGRGGGSTGSADFTWSYKESFGALNHDTVKNALTEAGITYFEPAADQIIDEAVNSARDRARARGNGNQNYRVVAIGYQYGINEAPYSFGGSTWNEKYATHEGWWNQWKYITNGLSREYRGGTYNMDTQFSGTSLNGIARELTNQADGHTELIVIALAENEPQTSYHVDVSTTAHPGNMYLRNNEPVYDTVHTRVTKGQWPAGNRLGATVWLNYEPGHGASAQPAKAVRHDFTIDHVGDTNTPQFRPSDFGWKNGWAIGTYWFDITIDKQNNMDAGVNTPDREKSETMILTPYGLDANTNEAHGNADLYSTTPVHDVVNVREIKQRIPQGVTLKAKSILHYEPTGQGGSQRKATQAEKEFTFQQAGSITSPDFTPADLGFPDGWVVGKYWWDLQIPQQDDMASAVDLPDRQPEESFEFTPYRVDATTNAVKADAAIDNSKPVHDTVHVTSEHHGSFHHELTARSILHFDGNPYVKAAQAVKEFTISQPGDVTAPEFTPADLGFKEPLTHGWPAGNYWFDVQIDQQWDMANSVDLADHDQAETFTITDEPTKKVDKTVEKPVSAHDMNNVTTLSFNTGKGGYELTVVDTINPQGNNVSVSDMVMRDVTAKKDVSDQYELTWDKTAHTVTARWKDKTRELPSAHDMAFTFKVKVSKPNGNTVKDTGRLKWNQQPELTTSEHEFRTWYPTPNKSWIRQDETTGKWQAVSDPDWSNATGADKHVFMDGDPVASVANGIIRSDLIENMHEFSIIDDYQNAAYIFQPVALSQYRVFMKPASEENKPTVADIVNTGTDITQQFTISQKGTKVTATAKPEFLLQTKGRHTPLQVTLLIPGQIALARGKGAAQMRQDMGLKPGDEINTCVLPDSEKNKGEQFTNTGMETVNNADYDTNIPYICVYAPPVKKQVRAEASQGGDQSDINLKTVFPGQKVEYVLQTKPDFSKAGDGYTVKNVKFIDQYDAFLTPDKQTVEMQNLSNGSMVSRKHYKTVFDEKQHMFTLTVTDQKLVDEWVKQGAPQLQVRFEGRVSKDIPGKKKVDNQWEFQIRNSLTPSNIVENKPPVPEPHKGDEQHPAQGDPSINIDGKTLLLGDKGQYDILLDALSIKDPAYKVYRLGIVDSYNTKYLKIDENDLKVTDETGKDVSDKFNLKIIDGTVYAFAKLVDTEIPATGETVKASQPKDLKAYAMDETYNPLTDPAIDQSLLGHTYHVLLPYTVIKVDPNTVVENTALQITNDLHGQTNTVKNPLKDLNPSKDVVIKVGDKSINNQAVYKNHYFLYQLNSSLLPADRAYEKVTDWTITDPLPAEFDQFTGQYALYAASDLYDGDTVVVKKGGKLAGSTFTPTDQLKSLLAKNGETQLFTLSKAEPETLTFTAGKTLLSLLSQNKHEFSWTVYVQVKRLKPAEAVVNQFTETLNGKPLKSNKVVTRTPDQTPAISVEKYDVKSGLKVGDRNNPKQALENAVDGTKIGFLITNTGNTPLSDITLSDKTVAGSGTVKDIDLTPLKGKTLQPGEQVTVYGTLHGVEANGYHTDRATVTGTPRLVCPVNPDSLPDDSSKPEADKPANGEESLKDKAAEHSPVVPGRDEIPEKPVSHLDAPRGDGIGADNGQPTAQGDKTADDAQDGKTDDKPATLPTPGADGLCAGTNITASDDWNGKRPQLASTGAGVTVIIIAAAVLLVAGAGFLLVRRKH